MGEFVGRFSLGEAEESEVVGGVGLAFSDFEGLSDFAVHHIDGVELPMEDFLDYIFCGMALGIHGYVDVDTEGLVALNGLYYALCELNRD